MNNESVPKSTDSIDQSTNSPNTCIGQPCFQLEKDAPSGKCTKLGYLIHMDLARRECLCRLVGMKELYKEAGNRTEVTQNPTPKLEEDIYFAGFIIRGTDETTKKIKQYILKETDAQLLYQKKDTGYLTIKKADENKP